jgi:hypothetical protein
MNQPGSGQPIVYYRKTLRKDTSKVSLDADMIRLLIAIDEHKSIHQIAHEVDMETGVLKRTVAKLLQQGLIEPVRKDVPVLNESFVSALKVNLSKAIGPMAEILIEDIAAEMKINPSDIPTNQAAELINNLSLEIPDESRRIEFKKSMIQVLKKSGI